MPVVSNTEKDPAGAPHRNALVHVRLVAALVGAYPGYVSGSDFSIIGEWSTRTDSDGDWSVDLVANELISPADTYYHADVAPKVGYPVRHEFAVPNGAGPYRVEDILTNPPANLPVLHLLDPTDAHDASAISVVPGGNLAATDAQAALLELDAQDTAEAAARAAADASILIDAGADLAAETTARIAADTAEASARTAADSTLTTNLAAEVTNRTADVNAEESRALAAESVLTTNLAAEVTNRTNAVSSEVTARTAADSAEASTRATADTTLTTNLAAEVSNRTGAVNAEQIRALAAESVLAGDIAGLDVDLGTIDTALAAEVTNRTAADTTLTTNLAAEVTNRTNADSALSASITSETANRVADVNAEETRALAAEALKANDNAVVKLTGAQTVAGKKTLSTAPEVTQSGAARVTRETRTPRQFGAPMNGVDPDTAGFRAALDAMGDQNSLRPAELVIDGPLMLDDTVTIQRKSGRITSPGWGSSFNDLTNSKAYIGWLGPPGIEMIRIFECWGLELEGLRGVGNSAAKPSAFIRFFMGDSGNSNQLATLRRIWVGPLWGYDTDHARQFSTGILWDGANLNNDMMRLDTVVTHMCDKGLKFTGTQMGEHEMTHVQATYCGVGVETASNIGITGLHCLGNDEYDLRITDDARVLIEHFSSEGSAAMADLTAAPCSLVVAGGGFQAGVNTRSDGRVINGQTPYSTEVSLSDFTFAHTAGPTPVIRLRGGAEKYLHLKNPRGIAAANIDMQADSGGEKRLVTVERGPRGGQSTRFVVNNFDQGDYDEGRFDFAEQDIAQRRANAAARFESWRQTAAAASEVGRWDFVAQSTRENIARVAASVGPDFGDSGELTFHTKYSGSPIAERLRLLQAGGMLIKNTTLNPSTNPIAGGILYVDKDDGALKYRGPSGTVTTIAPA